MNTFVLGKLQCVSSYIDIFFNYFTVERIFVFLLKLEMIGPVSYTHLDVYKRQNQYREGKVKSTSNRRVK